MAPSARSSMNAGDLVGCFLIAMPSLQGDAFERTLVYLCEHDASGAMGLIVNRTSDVSISDVVKDFVSKEDGKDEADADGQIQFEVLNRSNQTVLLGGPVSSDRGFVLHAPYKEYASTVRINERLGLTRSFDILEDIGRGQGPKQMLMALGYAGWSAGQLEKELVANAWLAVPANEHILFETLPSEKYDQAIRLLGINELMLSDTMGHA